MQELNERWRRLWSKSGALGNARIPFHDLLDRYREPWRAYHTVDHIAAMLKEFDHVVELAADPNAILWAIWYHDAVYYPKDKENEEKSASLFMIATMFSLINKDVLRQKVKDMIVSTKHVAITTDPDTQLLCDIDLSILGQQKSVFDEYERQIRREYEWVPEHDFTQGRSEILRSFLDRRHIYSTLFFRDKYEEVARKNLTRSLEQLSSRLQP